MSLPPDSCGILTYIQRTHRIGVCRRNVSSLSRFVC
jgi:hypothetical protein